MTDKDYPTIGEVRLVAAPLTDAERERIGRGLTGGPTTDAIVDADRAEVPVTVEDLPLVVTHSDDTVRVTVEAEKTCATCHLWQQRYAAMGECYLPFDLSSQVQIDMNGNSTAILLTPETHSCAGWRQRGGE